MALGVYSSTNNGQPYAPGAVPKKTAETHDKASSSAETGTGREKPKLAKTPNADAVGKGNDAIGSQSLGDERDSLVSLFEKQVDGAKAERSAAGASRDPAPPSSTSQAKEAAADGTAIKQATSDDAAADEAAFKKQMFKGFASTVDEGTRQRLSTWLPDTLNGDTKALSEAAKGLKPEQARDLSALAETIGVEGAGADTASPSDGDGLFAKSTSTAKAGAASVQDNLKSLQHMQQRFGEHSLKEATPQLAPTASYDVNASLDVAKAKVYEDFVSGVDDATKQQLDTWLPEALDDRNKLPKDPNAAQGEALEKLAISHGLEKADARLRAVVGEYDRQVATSTAGELPTVVDMMLTQHDGKYSNDGAFDIKVEGDNIAKGVETLDAKGFNALDSWLPDALAGNGGIPAGDPEAMTLLGKFAEEMGMADGATASPEAALDFIKDSGASERSMHAGKTGDDAYLLFSDKFLDTTIAYGAKNGAVNGGIEADAARTAETLLGPDDGSGAPRSLDTQALMAAVAHRTDQPLSRPQEVQGATGYINKAETLQQQKERLADTLTAFHVREEIGTPPMTPRMWAESFSEISPEMVGKLDERAFNDPTGREMRMIADHLGVPGDHEFMIDKKRIIQIENDELGNVESFDQDKIKKDTLGTVLDIAIPVVATALTFTGWGTAAGVALNAAYSTYKGAQAIKEGDLVGGALAIAGGIPGGGAVSTGARLASTGLQTYRAAESGDYLGALASGLGGAAMAGGGQAFQTAATGINVGRSIDEGDYLAAASGAASIAGDVAGSTDSASQFAFEGIERSLDLANAIDDKNYAGIGNAASGLIQTGGEYHEYREEQAQAKNRAAAEVLADNELAISTTSSTPANQAVDNQNVQVGGPVSSGQDIELASGDTLSKIANRHGVSVDDLLATNPQITDPNRIYAGEQLRLPNGVQPMVSMQQDRLQEFANVQGRPPVSLSPPRPEQGNPMAQSGAAHLDAAVHYPASPQPGAMYPNTDPRPADENDSQSLQQKENPELSSEVGLSAERLGIAGASTVAGLAAQYENVSALKHVASHAGLESLAGVVSAAADKKTKTAQTVLDMFPEMPEGPTQAVLSDSANSAKFLGHLGTALDAADPVITALASGIEKEGSLSEKMTEGVVEGIKRVDNVAVQAVAAGSAAKGTVLLTAGTGTLAAPIAGGLAGEAAGRLYSDSRPDKAFDNFVDESRPYIQEKVEHAIEVSENPELLLTSMRPTSALPGGFIANTLMDYTYSLAEKKALENYMAEKSSLKTDETE